jgi:hypothetical protein
MTKNRVHSGNMAEFPASTTHAAFAWAAEAAT